MANGKYDAADLSGSNYGGLKISNAQETFNKDSKDARIAELEAQLSKYYRKNIKLESDVLNSLDHLDIVCKKYEAKLKDQKVAFEAQLKTAKKDGIFEAVDKLTGYVVVNDFQSDWVYSSDDLVDYANNLTGEE